MRLTLFGATGRTGQHLLEQALAAGHEVTVLARDPSKVKSQNARLKTLTGNVQNTAQVEQAIADSECVISVLGPTEAGLHHREPGLHEHDEEAGDERPDKIDCDFVVTDGVHHLRERRCIRVLDGDVLGRARHRARGVALWVRGSLRKSRAGKNGDRQNQQTEQREDRFPYQTDC